MATLAAIAARQMESLSSKWVKTWMTVPEACHAASKGAAAAEVSPSMRAVQAVVGTSVMPPSRPLSMRRLSRISPSPVTAMKAAPYRTGFCFFAALTGKSSGSESLSAAQAPRNGQSEQAGRFGVQIVAPRSIIAWAKSPGRSAGVSSATFCFIAGFAAGSGVAIA